MEAYVSIYGEDKKDKIVEEKKYQDDIYENFLQFAGALQGLGYDLNESTVDDIFDAYTSFVEEFYLEINEEKLSENWQAAFAPLRQRASAELRRLGSQALNKYAPRAYKAGMSGLKDLGRAGIELAKTAHSFPANAFRYTLGDRGILRNPVVQAGIGVDALARRDQSLAGQALKPVTDAASKFLKPKN